MLHGFRPTISNAPSEQAFAATEGVAQFTVSVIKQAANTIDRVVLLRPASLTHFFDCDQRYIELKIVPGSQTGTEVDLQVISPSDDLGPSGWYTLHVVERTPTGTRVPSAAHFIRFL